ncbi:MAG: tetratricopeptide repeat protein [Gemmatimonadota bacterium]|nr:tetratricopeptide repeat protein [Gemmatimonadota bacterium]
MAKRRPGQDRTKEGQGEPDDLFIARVLELGRWAQANQQVMTILGVLLVIAIAGVVYYGSYRRSLNEQAAQQLETIHQSIGIEDRQGARDQLITFMEQYGGTAYEGEARLLLGELYLEGGDAEQALAVLEPLGGGPREPIELQGAMLLAKAYEQNERWSEAEETYLTIADRSELSFQVEEALASAARIRAQEDDPEGAIDLYERALSGMDEDDPRRGLFEMRIAELEVRQGT